MAEKAPKPVPDGMHTLTTQLWFDGNCNLAIDFYQKAFGAELIAPIVEGPGGQGVMHAMLKFGDSQIMMADAMPGSWETGPKDSATASLWIYVEDVDTAYNQSVKTGCEVIYKVMDAFWGDRTGKVKDPFGHTWTIASHKWDYTPEEIEKGQKEWLENLNQ